MKHLLSILSLFLLIVSCDPCNDCDSISFEPTVTFIFINQDSVSAINDSLAVINTIDSSLTANIDSLTVLRDSLQTVIDSIANGGSLSSQQMDLEQWIADRQADSTTFAIRNEGSDSISNILTTTRTTINSGLLLVEQIDISGANQLLTYTDSATSWIIPLAFDGSFTEYNVTIAGVTETIELDYDNVQEIDEQRNVLIRAENIRVINEPYDSLINCEQNCIDGEATFTFYF